MGHPKALLPIRGTTFLDNILAAISASMASPAIVVVGHHRDEITPSIRSGAVVAFNANYEQGMITSIQTGIRSLPADTDGALLFLVDHPLTHAETINSLIAQFRPGHIILPTFEGRRGHPVLFAREILDEILELPPSSGANTVVWRNPSRIIEVPVGDSGIVVDIDTPEQYNELQS